MNYKLAKELKDAGFPQRYVRGQMMYDLSIEPNKEGILPDGTEEVFMPTLSELIEACGEGFGLLVQHIGKKGKWYNTNSNSTNDGIQTFGDTPSEAVAKLWLSLNPVDTKR